MAGRQRETRDKNQLKELYLSIESWEILPSFLLTHEPLLLKQIFFFGGGSQLRFALLIETPSDDRGIRLSIMCPAAVGFRFKWKRGRWIQNFSTPVYLSWPSQQLESKPVRPLSSYILGICLTYISLVQSICTDASSSFRGTGRGLPS